MKKIIILFVAIAVIPLASCSYKNPYPPVDTDSIPEYVIDSIINNISDIEDSTVVTDSTIVRK